MNREVASINLQNAGSEIIDTKAQTEVAGSNIIEVENLCMYFGGIKAVDGLSFEVRRGEIFGLIGPNGAGKTTVFNCITQFYRPTSGRVLYRSTPEAEAVDLSTVKIHDVSTLGIVRTFQNVEVVPELSVLDNLRIAAYRSYTSSILTQMLHLPKLRREEDKVTAKAMEVLEFLGLTLYKDFYAHGLPYGILKKVEIARTLMSDPKLIILDEPAAGLNDTETEELIGIIGQIQEKYGCTILLVEHDMGLVMKVCNRILAISFGKHLALGTPEEIQASPEVQRAYLGEEED
ncbi:MAG: ABC transporter ATP-binding protein [Clostridiales bacterium]|nr:ABC transporter ATP-binding protein [Clostridiales bacterium]